MALSNFEVVTLFVPDIEAARSFYQRVFDVEMVFGDAVSAVFRFETVMVNLLLDEEATQLVEPENPARTGVRSMMTIKVGDVNAECERLRELGVALLNGPIDRPWGRRTAAFLDPGGHAWELAQEI